MSWLQTGENAEKIYDITSPRTYLQKQKEVLDAIERRHIKSVLYSGAYGAGKTLLECHVVIRQCLMYPKSVWLMGCQTIPMLRDTVLTTFMEELGEYQSTLRKAGMKIRLKKSWLSGEKKFTFYNNSVVLFRSFDDETKFKSLNLDGFAIDEPVDIDEGVFNMLIGRLRAKHSPCAHSILAGNPSGKTNWVYKNFFEEYKTPPLCTECYSKKTEFMGKFNSLSRYKCTKCGYVFDSDYYAVETTTYDNKVNLPSDYIPNMERKYDRQYQERYLKGKWGSFEGQIYQDFDADIHTGDYSGMKFPRYRFGFDFGFRNPSCLLIGGITDTNKIYIVDEFYKNKCTSRELVTIIQEYNKQRSPEGIYVDPSAADIITQMMNVGLPVYNGDNDLDFGISKIKAYLRAKILFIDKNNCKNTIREFESYRYSSDKQLYKKNLTEIPIKKDDHAPDAARYLLTDYDAFREDVGLSVGFHDYHY